MPRLACKARLVKARPLVGAREKCCARFSRVVSNASSATHCQIRPQASAWRALSLSPSMASPMARARPTRRGSTKVPPVSGIRPSLQNDWMKLADSLAMTMSPAKARLAPAPAATPLTPTTTGIGKAFRRRTSGA